MRSASRAAASGGDARRSPVNTREFTRRGHDAQQQRQGRNREQHARPDDAGSRARARQATRDRRAQAEGSRRSSARPAASAGFSGRGSNPRSRSSANVRTSLPARAGQPSAVSASRIPSPAQTIRHKMSARPGPALAIAWSKRRLASICAPLRSGSAPTRRGRAPPAPRPMPSSPAAPAAPAPNRREAARRHRIAAG